MRADIGSLQAGDHRPTRIMKGHFLITWLYRTQGSENTHIGNASFRLHSDSRHDRRAVRCVPRVDGRLTAQHLKLRFGLVTDKGARVIEHIYVNFYSQVLVVNERANCVRGNATIMNE